MLFWGVHRIFTESPLSFPAVIGVLAFSNSITALGFIATALLQLLTGNIGSSFSLGEFFPFSEHYFLNSFLTRIDVFLVWQYVAVSTAIASLLGAANNVRVILSILSVLFFSIFVGSMTWWSYQLFMAAVK